MMGIGIDVKEPNEVCDDTNCPFHGNLKVRGQTLEGKVVSTKAHQTVSVEREYYQFLKKYERYEKKRSKVSAHSPKCMNIEVGDTVKIMECKPISKTKSFVLIEKVGQKE